MKFLGECILLYMNGKMSRYYIVGFKKRRIGYYVEKTGLELRRGDLVIVQAERGYDLGYIVGEIRYEKIPKDAGNLSLEILRLATESEKEALLRLRNEEAEALDECEEFVVFRGLKMKLIDAEYQFDKGKLTFYFTADNRVDFRELVKDLAAHFRTRIELRQLGVRDETRKLGGFGPCGRELCCTSFLISFESISTQFIQEQNLAVNPTKLSGVCGRLMCCLAYEQPFYKECSEKYPKVGEKITTDEGEAEIIAIDYLRERLNLKFPDDRYKTITFKEWKLIRRRGRNVVKIDEK